METTITILGGLALSLFGMKIMSEGLCDVNSGLLFIDMLTAFEKIGDHAYNIAEGISGLRIF